MRVPEIVVTVVAFAVVFVPGSWLFNRSHFSWRGAAFSIVLFGVFYWLGTETGAIRSVADQLNSLFHAASH